MKHKTQKQSTPNIVRTRQYNCAMCICETNGSSNNLPYYYLSFDDAYLQQKLDELKTAINTRLKS